jgi:hypothetical protein
MPRRSKQTWRPSPTLKAGNRFRPSWVCPSRISNRHDAGHGCGPLQIAILPVFVAGALSQTACATGQPNPSFRNNIAECRERTGQRTKQKPARSRTQPTSLTIQTGCPCTKRKASWRKRSSKPSSRKRSRAKLAKPGGRRMV